MPQKIMKYTQRSLNQMKWPQVLVLKDKHETEYYLCQDLDGLYRTCLEILAARLHPQYGYIRKPEGEPYGLTDELTAEQAEALPASYRKIELARRDSNELRRKQHADALLTYNLAEQAVKEQDGPMAYEILKSREDFEYEGFELVRPRTP